MIESNFKVEQFQHKYSYSRITASYTRRKHALCLLQMNETASIVYYIPDIKIILTYIRPYKLPPVAFCDLLTKWILLKILRKITIRFEIATYKSEQAIIKLGVLFY